LLTWTLEDELEALLAGEADECLVCGERVEPDAGMLRCRACGSSLSPAGSPGGIQLTLAGGR
jgi:hypothetical protein